MFIVIVANSSGVQETAIRTAQTGRDGANAIFDRWVKKYADDETFVEMRFATTSGKPGASKRVRASWHEAEADGEAGAEPKSGEQPFDVEDEDGEWHRVNARTIDAAERKAQAQGIAVACVMPAEADLNGAGEAA